MRVCTYDCIQNENCCNSLRMSLHKIGYIARITDIVQSFYKSILGNRETDYNNSNRLLINTF